jgi:PAS domain S-box-containing protein
MDNLFKIGTIAERTGFSTHVLRAWERRHGLLEPVRSDSGQRLYTEDDLAVLLRVRALKDEGRRIGEIARMGRSALLDEGSGLVADDPDAAGRPEGWHPLPATLSQALLEALPCGVILTDGQGCTRWINSGFSEMCGYGLAGLRDRTPGSVLQGPATDERTVSRMRHALSDQRPFTERVLNYHSSGRLYWTRLDVTPFAGGGSDRGFVGVARAMAPEAGPQPPVRNGETGSDVQEVIRSLTRVAADGSGPSRLLMSLADVLSALPDDNRN